MCEPNKAVQDEELEALRAIFEDDWHDIAPKRTAWGTEGEHGWWEVQLRSTEDARVSIKLRGRLTKTYPDTPPLLSLIEPTKLTPAHVRTLTKLVQDKAKTSVGAPMIFDLADMVREWISANHVPLPKPGEREPTLMEEMAQREEAQRAAEAAALEADKEQRRVASEEKNRLLNEKIMLDATRKQERMRRAQADAEERQRAEKLSALADGELEMRELVLDVPITVRGHDGQYSKWTLFAGRREPLWTSYTAEPAKQENSFVTATMPTVTVQVVDFSKSHYQGPHGKKRIDTLINEINRLKEVQSPHVAQVYAVQRGKSPKGWERVIIVVERVAEGGKLKTWLPSDGFGEETAKEYITQILSALVDMHRVHVYQKQLDTNLVLMSPGDTGEVCLKLTGTGYARRIIEYHRSNPFLHKFQEEGYPDSWQSPDEIESPYSYSPKRDMWHAGLILLQLLFGKQCLLTYHDLPTLQQHVPGGFSNWVTTLLAGLLNPSAKKRLTAEEALSRLRAPDEESTRRPISRLSGYTSMASSQPQSAASSWHPDMFGKSPSSRAGSFFPTVNNALRHHSRYRTDFEEVEFLGKGAFGEVVKARNRLDGRPYAIKKVKLRPEDDATRVLREVQSLSRVDHKHIVRYFSCWLEQVGPPEATTPADDTPGAGAVTTSTASSESEDIFAVNFDDLSVSHHSRSASFPRIRFADSRANSDDEDGDSDEEDDSQESRESDSDTASDDSDDDSDSSADTVGDPSEHRKSRSKAISIPSKPSASTDFTGTTTDDGSVQEILYIQMEFVEKQTLREAIQNGLSEEQCWRLFVQILQALAHMSSIGIVHRDLKPTNILIDANGNIKIADFGLSTTDLTTAEVTFSGSLQMSGEPSERTSNIGTSLYIAPEVLLSRTYNEKADMYSVGIIFFEMCYTFKTGMERVATLTALRQPSVTFPAAWPPEHKPKQREIISLLLRHNPEMRPQATQLLDGPLVPSPDVERRMYDGLITEITNPRSEKYPDLVDALFASHANAFGLDTRIDDFTYDNSYDDGHYVWQSVVLGRIAEIFQRHGAVDDYLPLLVPETTLLNVFPDLKPVRLLDHNGKFVQLPSSNLLRMARSASRRQIERIKRYNIGMRYSELAAGGQPQATSELCFDIVSPLRSQVAEAELLEVIDKVMTECQGNRSGSTHVDYELHVSHESVLAVILSTVPVHLRPRVIKAFKGSSTGVSFEPSRSALESVSGLPRHVLHDLEHCTGAGEFATMRNKLEETFPSARRKLASALDEISTIISLARACGVTRKILFRPTLSRGAECFRGGFIFECVRRGRGGEAVAFGGRYDSLLDHFKEPSTQSRKVYGVGMSLNGDILTRMVAKFESALSHRLMNKAREEARSFGVLTPNRCDVYVGTYPEVPISYRLQIVGELWRAGIRADLQYDDGRLEPELLSECKDQNILFLAMVRAPRPQKGDLPPRADVKVIRVLTGKSDDDVERKELAGWLQEKIAEQRRIDASYGPAATPITTKKEDDPVASGPEAEIRLVLPPEPLTSRGKNKVVRKHRHGTKSVYYDKARDFATSVQSMLPVIGVDMPSEFLSQLAFDLGWIHDDDAWRTVLHTLPTSDRGYANHMREAVLDHCKNPGGNVWLFNVRDARGFLLQVTVAR